MAREPETGILHVAQAALALLNRRMSGLDAAVAELFADDALLVGSEPGEVARGRQEIATMLHGIQARGLAVHWDMPDLDCSGTPELCWLYGEGHAVIVGADGTRRVPYRISGILERTGDGWRWRLFHGSEPAR